MTSNRRSLTFLARAVAVAAGVAVVAGCSAAVPSSSSDPGASGSTPAATAAGAGSGGGGTGSASDGGTTADRADSAAESTNEKLVLALFSDAFPDPASASAIAAVDKSVASDAVAHGADVSAGPAGLLAQFTAAHTRIPAAQAVVKRTAADGDLVAVHWQLTADPQDERTGEAAVDLFRVIDGKVTERWSFSQQIPQGTPASGNTNTMFSDLYANAAEPGSLTEDQEESNRTTVVDAYNTLFRDQDPSVLDRAFDPNYLQHNSVAPNGTAALKGFFSGGAQFPPIESTISLADGDLVWLFSQSVGAKPGDPYTAADIFRIDDNLIREHWDVVPATPAG